jgi:hypothetical protein
VAIDLLEYFAKYGYLLTRNWVQIFSSCFYIWLQTDIWLQTEIPRKTLSDCGVRRQSPVPRGSSLRGPFLLPTHVTNGSAGGSPLWLRFCGGPRVPRESDGRDHGGGMDGGFLKILCSPPTLLTTLRSYF